MYVKVKEDERLVRDMNNNSLLNTDKKALKKHEMVMLQRQGAKQFSAEFNKMKNDISELKEMLQLLINRDK
jgi:hypothetical protein